MDITSWIIFVCFKYIELTLNLIWSIISLNSQTVKKLEHMEYICDKIIPVTKFEKIAYIFQNEGCEGNYWKNFFSVWYWHTSIKSRTI
jgi:hypothetical protein